MPTSHFVAGNPTEARRAAIVATTAATAIIFAIAVIAMGSYHFIGRIYTDDDAVVELVGRITLVCGACLILDAVLYMCLGVISGQVRGTKVMNDCTHLYYLLLYRAEPL